MSKSKVWRSAGQWHVCLTLLMWSWLQTVTKSKSGLPPPVCQCPISGYVVDVCHIPCPLDCKLSDWSAWSVCSASCGSGLKIRSKWLREKAFNGGRPCPKLDLKNQVSTSACVSTASCTVQEGNKLWKVTVIVTACWCLCHQSIFKSHFEPLFDCSFVQHLLMYSL